MSDAIHTDTLLPLPPEKARRALTDSKSLAPWLMPIDFEHRVDHHSMFHTDPVLPASFADAVPARSGRDNWGRTRVERLDGAEGWVPVW